MVCSAKHFPSDITDIDDSHITTKTSKRTKEELLKEEIYPYLKLMKDRTDKQYVSQFQYYNEMLAMYTGSYQWNSYLDYYGVSRSEYKDMVDESAMTAVKEALVLQQIYDELGLSVTDADVLKIVESLRLS